MGTSDPWLQRAGRGLVSIAQQWNWKTAVLSSLFRGSLFFSVNLSAGWRAAVGAMVTEFLYRAATAGFYGAITQRLRAVEPEWKAMVLAVLLLPAAQHTLEAAVHLLRGTPKLAASIMASVAFTLISTTFNLFAMRRGALIVGHGSRPLRHDLARMPGIVFAFATALPTAVYRQFRTGSAS